MSAVPSRRRFLQGLGAIGGSGALAVLAPAARAQEAKASRLRPVLGRYSLGMGPNWTTAITRAEVRYLTPSFRTADSGGAAGPRAPEFEVTLQLSGDPFIWQWINEALSGKPTARDGFLDYVGAGNRTTDRVSFFKAVPTRVSLDKLSGASKDVPTATIVFSAQASRLDKGGQVIPPPPRPVPVLAGNFTVGIPGVDLRYVTDVSWPEISVSQGTTRLGPLKLSTALRGPAAAHPLVQWLSEGLKGAPSARSGKIALLDPGLRTELLTCSLAGVRPLSVSMPAADSGQIQRIDAELLVGSMQFAWHVDGAARKT
jgi:hypothetical protein